MLAAREILSKRDSSQDVTPSRLTFGEIAEERFEVLESLVAAGERSARTLEAQRRRYNSNLRDTLGNVRVQAITTRHVVDVLAKMRAKRIKRGPTAELTPCRAGRCRAPTSCSGRSSSSRSLAVTGRTTRSAACQSPSGPFLETPPKLAY